MSPAETAHQSISLITHIRSRVCAYCYLALTTKRKLIASRYEHVKPAIEGVFEGVLDRFNGITIDSVAEVCDEITFDEKLSSKSKVTYYLSLLIDFNFNLIVESLDHWTEQKKRAIWFKVHRDQAHWVPILARNDFFYHHARGENVMMYKWLPKDEPMAIPPFSHTMVSHSPYEIILSTHFILPMIRLRTYLRYFR
jgi:hypothetical protein